MEFVTFLLFLDTDITDSGKAMFLAFRIVRDCNYKTELGIEIMKLNVKQ